MATSDAAARDASSPSAASDIPAETLATLYRCMLLARRLDLDCVAMQRQGILPGYAPMQGQEAAQVGSGLALDAGRDFAFPTYRELGVAVAMGVDLVGYTASHQGSWHGGLYDPAASHFAPINAVVGGPVPHAVGWAMGAQLNRTDACAIAYFGDGASSQGDVHEAMNFAGIYRLPVIFFCQNNGWAISLPSERQVAGGSVAARAAGYGMPGVRIDGNDVLAVYRATRDAVETARSGGGPTVIEAMTYRVGPHSTSDDPGRYRSLAEEQSWLERDPLTRFAARLRTEFGFAEVFFDEAGAAADVVVQATRTAVTTLVVPPGGEMFDFVFSAPPAALLEQREAWQRETQTSQREG